MNECDKKKHNYYKVNNHEEKDFPKKRKPEKNIKKTSLKAYFTMNYLLQKHQTNNMIVKHLSQIPMPHHIC